MSKVFFVNNGGGTGSELWVTDGTPAGSHLVKDIGFPDASPQLLTNVDGTLYFTAFDAVANNVVELEKSDGTAAGTNPIVIIPDSVDPSLPAQNVSPIPTSLTDVGGTLFFTADDTIHGRELWSVTPAGTATLVKDIVSGSLGSNPEGLLAVNGTLFFTATDLVHGQELWKSDGTAAGTVMVKDINAGSPTSNLGFYPNVDGTLLFIANDGAHGYELWTSDGTTAGTVMVKDINPGAGDTTFGTGANFQGLLLFSADDGTHGFQLWRSDDTAAGTSVFSNITGVLERSAELNGFLYFVGNDGTHGLELWRTDGTTAGTTMVADINTSGNSDPRSVININGTLYFTAIDGTHGRELWRSDGTAAGTMLVADIRSGSVPSNPAQLINADGTLYLRANDGSGAALWKSDGTPGGTVKLSAFSGFSDAAATPSTVRSSGELLVNTNTGGNQTQASVAALLDGRFVVVWTDASHVGGDASGSAIHGQIFHADGSKSGPEFLGNTSTANDQSAPVVSTLADGEFYIVWQDFSNGADFDIRSQVFHSDGTRNGGENTEAIFAGNQTQPAIISLPDITAFPVWVDSNTAFYGSSNFTDVADGETNLSSGDIAAHNIDPATAARVDGRYLVTWATDSSLFGDGSGYSIRAQIFDVFGAFHELTNVNTTTAGDQTAPSAAALANGNFVIVWEDHSASGGDTSGSAIRGLIVDGNANPVSSEFLVNVTTAGDQTAPSVAALADGRFVVVFSDTSASDGDHSGSAIRAEILNADGTQAGEDFVINTTTAGDQIAPKVAVLSDGRFVVTWDDNSQSGGDTSGHAVRAQIIDPRLNGVTVDGTSANDDFVGSSLHDIISGGPGDDHLAGGRGKDNLSGGDGNDILNGGPGNDTVDGGPGSDMAIFAGSFSLYTITTIAGGFQVSGPDGVDTLTNIEFAKFDDGTIPLTTSAPPPPPPPPPTTTLQGTPGDDSFTALPGNERIDAGLGNDTVNFNFKLTDAAVSFSGNQVIVDTLSSHTVLTGFEIYVFADGTVNNNDADPLVDDLFYYSQYHDVWNAHADADAHYHQSGWHEGRNPDAFFDTNFYLSVYPDVRKAGADPLVQFDQSGWKAGHAPSLSFDDAKYLQANPDVAAAHVDPLAHFLANGAQEGRQPFALTELIAGNGFDYVYYLQHNPDVAAAHIDPFQHFETSGWKEGRNPNALFDTNGYLATYADVKAAGINPLDHYHAAGWTEGRDPSVGFDTSEYLGHYADVAAAHIDPLMHFLQSGIHEGRSPFADGVWG